ncbi:uncharacterized protein [Antedon mediterranea]|uniref:uncharacterized protein n=1 Tax=Antedon mediterranea TaxID=105859 RepID=UPI003AF58398
MKTAKEIARELGLLRRHSSSSQNARDLKKAQKCSQEFMFLIVIDFESTCWKEKQMNTGQEIIEFPAVLLNTSTGAIVDEFHSYVLPMEKPQLSKFCTEFTGITQDMVESGAPISVILSQFLRWLKKLAAEYDMDYHVTKEDKKLCTFVTWSDWDLGMCLQRECLRKQIYKPPVLESWIDLRATYKNFYQRKPNGLNGALQDVGIQFEGRQHSGLDDARNTSQLAWKMICDGCQMSITKTLDKGRSSSGLTRSSSSNQISSAHKENTVIEQCLQRPSTSSSSMQNMITNPNYTARASASGSLNHLTTPSGKQSIHTPGTATRPVTYSSSYTTIKPSVGQSKNTSVGQSKNTSVGQSYNTSVGQSKNISVGQSKNTSVGQSKNTSVGQSTNTTIGQFSLSKQNHSNPALPKNTSKVLQTPAKDVNTSGRQACKDLHKTIASAQFEMPFNTFVLKETMNRKFKEKTEVTENENDVGKSEKVENHCMEFTIVNDTENTDLNACFIEYDDKENNTINKDKPKAADDKLFTPLRTLKQSMKMPFTNGIRFNASKIHSEFKPPEKSNSILKYLKNTRKSLGTLNRSFSSIANDRQTTGCHPYRSSKKDVAVTPTSNSNGRNSKGMYTGDTRCSSSVTTPTWCSATSLKISNTNCLKTPTWNNRTSLQEKITPPMCGCGRRTKRKVASKPGPNQNSPFFVCPKSNGYNPKERKGCGYFQWESSVVKKNLQLFRNTKNTERLSIGSVQIRTTPLNSTLKCSLGRPAFRMKPY